MATVTKAAVITADTIESSRLTTARRRKMQHLLQSFFKEAAAKWPDWKAEQYRGDSLQAVLTKNRWAALRASLQLYSLLASEKIHIRISIGVGDITFTAQNIIASDGTAFRASGPYLDALKKNNEFISIAGSAEEFTAEWQVHSASLHYIMHRWSPQQAEAMNLQLQQHTQEDIARKLKISQPSVHQRLQAAGAPVVQKMLLRFESVVPSL